ncbi:MAG: hypothetical protein ACTSQS_13895, partial [Promethearchaeota archaeon]
ISIFSSSGRALPIDRVLNKGSSTKSASWRMASKGFFHDRRLKGNQFREENRPFQNFTMSIQMGMRH